jgi:hypothetical protein
VIYSAPAWHAKYAYSIAPADTILTLRPLTTALRPREQLVDR